MALDRRLSQARYDAPVTSATSPWRGGDGGTRGGSSGAPDLNSPDLRAVLRA